MNTVYLKWIGFWGKIHHMLEVYKRCWVVFFPVFVALLALALQALIFLKNPALVTLILLALAMVCLIIGITAFVYDIKDGRKRDRDERNRNITI